ncbi:MAG: tetratricopeptide repeat protein, partial [Chloroflexota bacterium]
ESPRYAYLVLELRCFNRYFHLHRTSDIWEQSHLLPSSKSQHYREFDLAIKYLATVFLERVRPAVHLEQPTKPDVLIGYDSEFEQAEQSLSRGEAVALVGAGGVGKTSVGAALVQRFATVPIFWYTLRPDLNDNINSLLVALGSFLRDLEAVALWQYLIAVDGKVSDLNIALGLLHQDLTSLTTRPLLCFDELEYLHAAKAELLPPQRAQIRELLESINAIAPMLLMGQRVVFDVHQFIELTGLGAAQIQQLWHNADLQLTIDDAHHLCTFTSGNPRLLTLCMALCRGGETVAQILATLDTAPGLLPIFDRLWRRLKTEERQLMQRLAVFRSATPQSFWQSTTLEALTALRVIEHDMEGGVRLLPVLRQAIYQDMSVELRQKLHQEAVAIRLDGGEYTAATYHLWQGGQPKQAIQVWFPQRTLEITRGHANAALAVFEGISRHDLGKPERKALDLIRGELRQLVGQLRQGLNELETLDWQDESETSTRLLMLRGEFQAALGYPDAAIKSYTEGIQVIARLQNQLVRFRNRQGMLHLHQRQIAQSWQGVYRAEYDTHMLRGHLLEEEGQYEAAKQAFEQAQTLAEKLQDNTLIAEVEHNLAALAGRQQHLESAIAHAEQAMVIYERIGDRVNLEKVRSNLSFSYVQAGKFREAVDVGVEAYTFFRLIREPYPASVTAANIAEAAYGLNDLTKAEHYANEVLSLQEPQTYPYAHFTLGQVKQARRLWQEAHTHFDESRRAAHQNEDVYLTAYALRALGVVAAQMENVPDAQVQLHAALKLFQEMGIDGEIRETEQVIADVDQRKLHGMSQDGRLNAG